MNPIDTRALVRPASSKGVPSAVPGGAPVSAGAIARPAPSGTKPARSAGPSGAPLSALSTVPARVPAPAASASPAPSSACGCFVPRRDFDFSSLAAGATSYSVPLVQNVPVGDLTSAVVALRLHTATLPAGAAVRIDVVAVGPTDEDPGVTFRGPIVAAFEIPAGATAPTLYLSPLGARAGTHVSAWIYAKQGGGGGTLKVAVSMALRPVEGGSAWTPAQLGSTMKCWLDERDQVVVSGAVSDWGDQSGGGSSDFTQGTSSLRPASGQSINHLGALDFDGTDDVLTSNALSTFIQASRYHVFVVFRAQTVSASSPTSYMNNPVVADGGAGWWGLFLKNNGGTLQTLAFHWASGERVAVASGLELNTPALVEASFDGSTIRCQVAGRTEATVSAGNVGALAETVKLGNGAIGAPYFDGSIAALIVCDTYLSATDRQNVRSYLSSKYGVPA